LTQHAHTKTTFQRAIERQNLLVAETVLRSEIPRPHWSTYSSWPRWSRWRIRAGTSASPRG